MIPSSIVSPEAEEVASVMGYGMVFDLRCIGSRGATTAVAIADATTATIVDDVGEGCLRPAHVAHDWVLGAARRSVSFGGCSCSRKEK